MITRRKLLATGAVLPLILVGCGEKEASGDEPPAIKLGRDTCKRCGMIISEERFASGIVDKNGDAEIFDDPGEMVSALQEDGLNGRQPWVHGYPSLEWMHAEDATYVVAKGSPTPMGTGVFPFDNATDAAAFASENDGVVYDWNELLKNWNLIP